MSYIGNQPLYTSFVTDTFSGNGSQITFTLSIAPANAASILVAIGGILQAPSAYGVVGQQLTFTGIPPTGTNNISVRYLGLPASNVITPAYRTVTDITATAGQRTFNPASYTPGFIDVFRNGVRLAAEDYTATNGAQVVLVNPAVAGDTITTVGFYVSSVLNAIPANAGVINSGYLANGAVGTAALDVGNFNGTGGMALPSGTTAQRPAGPSLGMHRWNTTLGAMEVYVGGATGWQTIASSTYTIDYLIVAGGGGGGSEHGGGGGAGGLIQASSVSVSPGTSYSAVVGAGGAGGAYTTVDGGGFLGTNGSNSTFFSQTAIGGGGGAPYSGQTGRAGGSGGGSYNGAGVYASGTVGQGNRGGSGYTGGTAQYAGGGGGGAGAVGGDYGGGNVAGVGGNGLQWVDGNYYAGGGGGGSYSGTTASGGLGGGGSGGQNVVYATNGTVNTGGGGGGSNDNRNSSSFGGTGGSGVVIVRYAGSVQRATGGTVTITGGYVYHKFTVSGIFTA